MMLDSGFFLEAVVVSVALAALLVAARLAVCAFVAARARRIWIVGVSVVGFLGVVTLFCALVAAWFMYGVAHTGKDMTTFVRMLLVTGVPYVLGLAGLWFLGGLLGSRLQKVPRGNDSGNG